MTDSHHHNDAAPLGRRLALRVRTVPALVAITALLAACGTEGDGESSEATAASQTPNSSSQRTDSDNTGSPGTDNAADSSADELSGFPQGTRLKMGNGSGGPLVLTDVRVKEHEGFDRIVLEFSGTGTPGWSVNYVKKAALEGSGETVDLDGDSTLNISASNSTWPADDYYSGPKRLGGHDVPDVYVGGTFEGYTQMLAGIDGPRAQFRVSTLTQPSRLVVDVVDR
ncbi:hypothetical protein ASG90_16105 [Nocardioides sp. Soil797]|nr:hypothetical protein ASG90_16105 [Nocardioides sp. Soil797]